MSNINTSNYIPLYPKLDELTNPSNLATNNTPTLYPDLSDLTTTNTPRLYPNLAELQTNPAGKPLKRQAPIRPAPQKFAHALPDANPQTPLRRADFQGAPTSQEATMTEQLQQIGRTFDDFTDMLDLSQKNPSIACMTRHFAQAVRHKQEDPPRLDALKQALSGAQRFALLDYYMHGSRLQDRELEGIVQALESEKKHADSEASKARFTTQIKCELVRQVGAGHARNFVQDFKAIVDRHGAQLERLMMEPHTAETAQRCKELYDAMNQELGAFVASTARSNRDVVNQDRSRQRWLDGLSHRYRNQVGDFPPVSAQSPPATTADRKEVYGRMLAMQMHGEVALRCQENQEANRISALIVISKNSELGAARAEQVLDAAVKYIEESDLISNFDLSTTDVEKFLQDPSYRNVFQTKTTAGIDDRELRSDWEDHAFKIREIAKSAPHGHMAPYYNTGPLGRRQVNPDHADNARPKYMTCRLGDRTYPRYGRSYLVFTQDVKQRATYYPCHISVQNPKTLCDNHHLEHIFNSAGPELVNLMVTIAKKRIAEPHSRFAVGEAFDGALQATVHGPLNLEHIAEIHLSLKELKAKYPGQAEADLRRQIDEANRAHRAAKGRDFFYIDNDV